MFQNGSCSRRDQCPKRVTILRVALTLEEVNIPKGTNIPKQALALEKVLTLQGANIRKCVLAQEGDNVPKGALNLEWANVQSRGSPFRKEALTYQKGSESPTYQKGENVPKREPLLRQVVPVH